MQDVVCPCACRCGQVCSILVSSRRPRIDRGKPNLQMLFYIGVKKLGGSATGCALSLGVSMRPGVFYFSLSG